MREGANAARSSTSLVLNGTSELCDRTAHGFRLRFQCLECGGFDQPDIAALIQVGADLAGGSLGHRKEAGKVTTSISFKALRDVGGDRARRAPQLIGKRGIDRLTGFDHGQEHRLERSAPLPSDEILESTGRRVVGHPIHCGRDGLGAAPDFCRPYHVRAFSRSRPPLAFNAFLA